jgi:hypothetical protein
VALVCVGRWREDGKRTRSPSSLIKIVEVPPWRAYVCIAFFRERIEGELRWWKKY